MLAKNIGLAALTAALALGSAGIAQAGPWPHERDGVVLGFNLGAGTAGVNVTGVDSGREGGFAAGFRVGYAFTPELAVGLDGTYWSKDVDNETWTFDVGGASLTYYPGAKGFFVRGGIGAGSAEYATESGGVTFTASDDGFGFLLGTGYEWRLTRKFALGPEVDYSYAKVSNDFSLNYVNFTVGLNWYF